MTRPTLPLLLIPALALAQPTIEVTGTTPAGDYVRIRGVIDIAAYTACPPNPAPCLDVLGVDLVVDGDLIFGDGFDG
jgi:hypothetical protein